MKTMQNPLKKNVIEVLGKIGIGALLVLLGAAAPQGEAGCCGTGTVDDTCYDYANFTSATPVVTFKANVLPIFQKSCNSAPCHGADTPPAGQPYLGPTSGSATTGQIDKFRAQNVNVASAKASSMMLIDPDNPEASFLMHKVDNTLTCSDVDCGDSCGAAMPIGTAPLSLEERDTIRRWIAQGAKNN